MHYLGIIPFLVIGVFLIPVVFVGLLLLSPLFLFLGLCSLADWLRR